MDDEELVEEVAKAIRQAHHENEEYFMYIPWEQLDPLRRERWLRIAKQAVAIVQRLTIPVYNRGDESENG